MLDLAIQAAFLVLANYLLAYYLTDKELSGPKGMFDAIRFRGGINVPVYGFDTVNTGEGGQVTEGYESNGTFLADLLDCPFCLSPYTALVVLVLAWITGFVAPDWSNLILWLAVTGATVYLFD